MTLILLDGCEDLSTLRDGGGTAPTIAAGRNGNCIRCGSASSNVLYDFHAAHESDIVTVGAAIRVSSIGQTVPFFNFRGDAGTTNHTTLQWWNLSGGVFQVTRATGSSIGVTSAPGLIVPNVWYYLEFQTRLHDTLGWFKVRLDGAEIVTGTDLDNKNAGTKTVFDQLKLGTVSGTVTDYDDLYVMNGAGDSFLGDIAVETLYPNGNGNANQWIGSDGNATDNYALVDEAGAPVLTDYTYSTTTGHQDMYALTDLARATGSIVGVCHSAHMIRTDAVTPANVKLVNRRSSDTKSAAIPLATTYRSYDYTLTVDPETGAPFTIANVNNLQTGVELA